MQENISIQFKAKLKPIKPINNELTLCKAYVLALGKNRNRSNITEDAVIGALPTLFNIPVVGHVFTDADGGYRMGGHDMKVEKDEDGKFKFKSLCVPFGVVPVQDNVQYEEIEESGEKRKYLVADVILWTSRFPELKEAIYSEDVYFGQSMEIKPCAIARNKEDKQYTDINKFTFSALCLLGKSDDEEFNYEPCFPGARVEPYKFALDEGFALLFEEFKKELKSCFGAQDNAANGGKEEMNDKEQAGVPEQAAGAADNGISAFAATYEGKRRALLSALDKIGQSGEDLYIRYYLADFDDKFAYTERSTFTKAGSAFTKGRLAYTMNGDETAVVSADSFETMIVKWLTADEAAALDKQRDEHAELTEYKAKKTKAEREFKFAAVIDEFSDLAEDEAFKALAQDRMAFASEDALREKLFALRGKKVVLNPVKTEMKVPVGLEPAAADNDEPYGGFISKYSNKKN